MMHAGHFRRAELHAPCFTPTGEMSDFIYNYLSNITSDPSSVAKTTLDNCDGNGYDGHIIFWPYLLHQISMLIM